MQLTIGFSPCPNDTFMMEALIHRRIPDCVIEWNPVIEDVETLNRWALEGRLDVTKLSFATYLRVQKDYALMNAGAALGHGCGPLLISCRSRTEEEILSGPVAIPGELTTANLLFSLRYPEARQKVSMLFSEIESAVLDEKVVAGVIIHENRFTYTQKGLVKILDLGEYWESETAHPIPLGAFVAKKSLGPQLQSLIGNAIRNSVQFAFDHPATVMPFVQEHAREMDPAVMKAHIDTYVSHYSIDLGSQGRKAVEMLRERAIVNSLT